jgi:hypothetical protein
MAGSSPATSVTTSAPAPRFSGTTQYYPNPHSSDSRRIAPYPRMSGTPNFGSVRAIPDQLSWLRRQWVGGRPPIGSPLSGSERPHSREHRARRSEGLLESLWIIKAHPREGLFTELGQLQSRHQVFGEIWDRIGAKVKYIRRDRNDRVANILLFAIAGAGLGLGTLDRQLLLDDAARELLAR